MELDETRERAERAERVGNELTLVTLESSARCDALEKELQTVTCAQRAVDTAELNAARTSGGWCEEEHELKAQLAATRAERAASVLRCDALRTSCGEAEQQRDAEASYIRTNQRARVLFETTSTRRVPFKETPQSLSTFAVRSVERLFTLFACRRRCDEASHLESQLAAARFESTKAQDAKDKPSLSSFRKRHETRQSRGEEDFCPNTL